MLKTKEKDNDIKYVYNAAHEIAAVQIPYDMYLDLVKQKRNRIIKEAVPEWEVGYNLLCASIEELRKKGMTLEVIAKHMGLQQPYLSKLLKTKRKLKPDTLAKYLELIDKLDEE